ncbi:hypothetical protein [Candidatus Ichthyocystis sparus]|uniref:hypothetical protein n=2 Tax=Candidatus Ichthyocystis sparus TaxID=1561004 RepID=UPI000B878E86|nr:hypothetical protein [Candidatus Ichthyocystis sparus]
MVAEPRSENLKKMEKELNEARARCKELEKAGAVEFSIGMDYIRTKEIKVSRDLEEAKAGEIRVKNIEVLVAKELYLEKIEAKASKKELGKVRSKKTKIESNLMQLRATIATTRRNVELELVNIITLKEEIEATIDRGKREIELNRLKEGAKAESGEKELELMLRIEGVNARVRMLELELGLWLEKITAKQLAVVPKVVQSMKDYDEGFILVPDLAKSLGMQPGQVLHQGMFYGTPQASRISALTAKLLKEQERLLQLRSGEATSSYTIFNEDRILDLVESNASAIQALLSSVEAPLLPPPTVAPAVIVGNVGNTHGKVPDVAKQSAKDSNERVRASTGFGTIAGNAPWSSST